MVALWCAVAHAQPAAQPVAQPAMDSAGGELAAVRVLRAGEGAETLDVWLGERRILADFGFGRPSGYVVVPAGRYELAVASPAGDAPGSAPSSSLGSVDLAPGGYATVVVPDATADGGAASEAESEAEPASTRPVVVHDPRIDLAPAGSAGLRLVHAAPGRPALALAVRPADGRPGTAPPGLADPQGTTRYVGRVAPFHGSAYGMFDAGSYLVWFVGEQAGSVLPEPVELQLQSGALYTVFLAEGRSGPARVAVSVDATRAASALRDEPAGASLRLLHASPDAPLVDLLVDGELTFRDVAPRSATAYAAVPPGRHVVRVFPHRLPGPTHLVGDGDGPDEAAAGDAAPDDAPGPSSGPEAGTEPEPAARPDVPRLEPVTIHVDVPPQQYTTLVLAGSFDPLPDSSTPGALSVAVEPTDAVVTVQGPRGVVASSPGPKLLTELAPGTYRIEVRKEGHRPARYEVDVRPEGTSVVNVTLQLAPDDSEAEDDGAGDAGGDAEGAPPTFVEDGAAQGMRRRLELHVYSSAIPTAEPGRARVRFVHVAPSVPHLEIVGTRTDASDAPEGPTDETIRIERLSYPNASSYVSVPAESQTLVFNVAGSRNRIRLVDGVGFRAGVTYTLYLVDRAWGLEFAIVPIVDAITPQRGAEEGSER